MSKFMLGCNYWDSKSGTDMWKNWDEDVVRDDLSALKAIGVKHLRVFPNWRDFQPVDKYLTYLGTQREYFVPDDADCAAPDYVDKRMITRFRRFAEISDENGMELTVSLLTGWMSGRLFFPPALQNKGLLTDAEALTLTNRYVTKLVNEFKDIKNIVMWDLGNECNCVERVPSRFAAYLWTMSVRNAIRAADPTRPIASGMHDLTAEDGGENYWSIKDQGELCDLLTTHPYPSPTIRNDMEPINAMRSTINPTAQSEFYAGVSKKPCMIQEQGSFSETVANKEAAADFLRVNVLSAWANNLDGYLWWCGMEHELLTEPPYSWSMAERNLGLLHLDRKPKPVGREMAKISKLIESLPKISKKRIDAVCVLPKYDRQDNAMATYVLAKQAGINLSIVNCSDELPDTDLIFFPCCHDGAYVNKEDYDKLFKRVEDGATLYVSSINAQFCEFEKKFGLRSLGMVRKQKTHTAHFPFGDIEYQNEREILLEPIGAEVLAVNEEGNPVFTKYKYGKGDVYLLNFGLELLAAGKYNAYAPEFSLYKVYQMIDKVNASAEDYIINTDDCRVGGTESACEGIPIVTAINYSDEDIDFDYTVKDGYRLEPIYGGGKVLPHCDAVIFKATKKSAGI